MKNHSEDFRKMTIERIDIYPFDIPLEDNFKIATMTVSTAENVLIRIISNEGLEGWGEAASLRSIVGETQSINIAAAKEIRSQLLGKNPLMYKHLLEIIDAYLPFNYTIISAFDMALYDLNAKLAGLPLYAFLGGDKKALETDITIGISSPGQTEIKLRAILDRGIKKIKIKVGLNSDDDFDRLKLIRDIVGSEPDIRIDANQAWNRVDALKNLERFREFRIEFCEQPVSKNDLSGLKYISDRIDIPIMADESVFSPFDALRLINENACPLWNIKLSKSGGIHNGQIILDLAQTAKIDCMVGSMAESKLGITAFSHFASVFESVKYYDLDAHFLHINEPIYGGVKLENGAIILPDTPGIGAAPNPDFIQTLKSF